MRSIGPRLIGLCVVAVILASCGTTPPPVRKVPDAAIERAKEVVRLRNERWEAEWLIREVPPALSSMSTELSTGLRSDLLTRIDDLKEALERNDYGAISSMAAHLDKYASLL